jgi:integrase
MTVRGSLPLKVRLPGCSPIRRASGTHDKSVLKSLLRMIHALHEQGRDDLVNAIAAGRLKPLQVYNRWKFQRLQELPHADELPTFKDTWPQWASKTEGSDNKSQRHSYCRRIEALMPPDASLAEIVPALQQFAETNWAHAVTVQRAQNALRAFVRDTLGRRHRLYLEVCEVKVPKVKTRRARHPLTPDQLRTLVHNLGQPWGAMAWTMATTGMGWREYTGNWEVEGEGLRIHGTKTHGRDRLVPLVSLLHPVQGKISAFRWHLDRATPRVTPYDLRRTFAGLMVEANVPRPRRKSYMGHSAQDMLGLYERQEVSEYLRRDAERMREVLGEPPGGPMLKMVRA